MWTPGFVLLTAATTIVLLLVCQLIADIGGRQANPVVRVGSRVVTWPWAALGRNALVVYVGQHVLGAVLSQTPAHLGARLTTAAGYVQEHFFGRGWFGLDSQWTYVVAMLAFWTAVAVCHASGPLVCHPLTQWTLRWPAAHRERVPRNMGAPWAAARAPRDRPCHGRAGRREHRVAFVGSHGLGVARRHRALRIRLVGTRSRFDQRHVVNNSRLSAEHRLRNGDEVRFGSSRSVFRLRNAPASTATAAAEQPPHVTRREHEVLVALCRPLLSGDIFTEAATVATIAADLVVTEAAVKFHLGNLYDKFDVRDGGDGVRRSRLANEAIRRRALTLSDLRPPT